MKNPVLVAYQLLEHRKIHDIVITNQFQTIDKMSYILLYLKSLFQIIKKKE